MGSMVIIFLRIDDSINAAAVHLGGGCIGAIVGPVLCWQGRMGGTCEFDAKLHVQLAGVGLIVGFTGLVTFVVCEALSRMNLLRCSQEIEDAGLDVWLQQSEHMTPAMDLVSSLPAMVPNAEH